MTEQTFRPWSKETDSGCASTPGRRCQQQRRRGCERANTRLQLSSGGAMLQQRQQLQHHQQPQKQQQRDRQRQRTREKESPITLRRIKQMAEPPLHLRHHLHPAIQTTVMATTTPTMVPATTMVTELVMGRSGTESERWRKDFQKWRSVSKS